MCIGAAVAYRYIGENATLQRSSWDWSVFNGVEHLRSVFNSAACGDISPISKQVQSVDDAQLCQIVAFANFHWYQHALIIASVIVWKKKKLEGLLDKFSTPVKFSNNAMHWMQLSATVHHPSLTMKILSADDSLFSVRAPMPLSTLWTHYLDWSGRENCDTPNGSPWSGSCAFPRQHPTM